MNAAEWTKIAYAKFCRTHDPDTIPHRELEPYEYKIISIKKITRTEEEAERVNKELCMYNYMK